MMETTRAPKSDSAAKLARGAMTRVLAVLLWLVSIDAAIFLVKTYWADSSLARLARRQESLEARIGRQFDSSGRPLPQLGGLAFAGWADPRRECYQWSSSDGGSKLRVSFYGMSFSTDIARALREVDPSLDVRAIDAPSSTASHSLAMAEVDRSPGKVAVLAILTSQVVKEGSMLGALISTGNTAAYTSPAMTEDERGHWSRIPPEIATLEDFGASIVRRDDRWHSFLRQMEVLDPLYSPFVFQRSWLDHSFVIGLIRRAWDRSVEDRASRWQWTADDAGTPRGVRLVRDVLERFVRLAQSRGECAIVLVIRTFRDPHDVCAPIRQSAEALGIPAICTDEVIDANDSANFKPDLHYTTIANRLIAESMLPLLKSACRLEQHPLEGSPPDPGHPTSAPTRPE